ncbi:hypothetical protein PLEOSDRAFT_1046294 [Pleurotus ostreatus PC15]|uniref:CxC5 like cysteine cluster associated with KDZ domain-containing protein n=1 Tax=Pleurotus ostreatus (strain PC15) TaxID=1137138 RepID=A0A067NBZ8_PLEO1|nr:hypothetical protein PLEOSDRAFT_1046294 [Pleurotus ostreatus PC15]
MRLSLLFNLGLIVLTICFTFGLLPCAAAMPIEDQFPSILFSDFAEFISENYGSEVTLSTVLLILFSLTSNPDLLNLHAKQQVAGGSRKWSESITGWMTALARAISARLGDEATSSLFLPEIDVPGNKSNSEKTTILAKKFNKLSIVLKLRPYNKSGVLKRKLRPISNALIQPALVICPSTMQCSTATCNGCALGQNTCERDTSEVTLLKGSECFSHVPVLSGVCSRCHSIFYADHESYKEPGFTGRMSFYLNNAKYLKVGQKVWVDRVVSNAIVNATYSFHASTAAITEFWNESFNTQQSVFQITRRHIWKAFVLEMSRQMAKHSGTNLILEDGISIDTVTSKAFEELGQSGIIDAARTHSCSECTHEYKNVADTIPRQATDPAGVVGVDENSAVPEYSGPGIEQHHHAQDDDDDDDAMDVDSTSSNLGNSDSGEVELVKMVVMDGIVMGPRHCAIDENSGTSYKNYFSAPRFYCVETLCAPCGVVIAWKKFAKSESPTKIVKFLEEVYPTPESKPSYVCIDKACVVLRHIVKQGDWPKWEDTTRFIVDSYHYINHRTTDYICRTWCNPAPLNGSAPNLVTVEQDNSGNFYYKRAFNTQACEQLNAWLGGFQTVLNKMSVSNFDFTIHALLFLHTQWVIAKQQKKKQRNVEESSDDSDDEAGVDIERDDEV